MVIEPAALHLRLRDDTSSDADEPDIAAFVRSGPAPGRRVEDALGVVPGTGPVDPDGPLVVFLQQSEFGIPLPGEPDGLPDLESWSVRPTKIGWIARVSPPTRGAGSKRAVQVLAGCLALTLPIPTVAYADAPASPTPTSTAPASATPVSPPAIGKAPANPTPASPAPVSPPATGKPSPTPVSPTPAPASPTTAPAPVQSTLPAAAGTGSEWTPGAVPTPPPRVVQDSKALADAAWEGVDGFVVIVELKGGKSLRGRVGAVQADTFTLIDTEGQVLVLPKSGVGSLRVYVPPPLPSDNGAGLIAGGSVLVALGVPVFITGITFVSICPSCVELHLPMLVVGGGALAGGIPLLSRGVQRRSAFLRAVEERRVIPMVGRTPFHGWTGGLQFRF